MKLHGHCFVWGALASAGLLVYGFQDGNQVAAQSGSRYDGGSRVRDGISGGTTRAMQPPRSFEQRFWDWLQSAQYRNWAPAPGQTDGTYPGQSPHGAFLKMYLNRPAAAHADEMPHGSILVKENFGEDGKSLMAVTVMYRAKGYDPDHNDWYYAKFQADGSIARTPAEKGNRPIAGRFQACIDCHSSAEGDDFVFSNDKNDK